MASLGQTEPFMRSRGQGAPLTGNTASDGKTVQPSLRGSSLLSSSNSSSGSARLYTNRLDDGDDHRRKANLKSNGRLGGAGVQESNGNGVLGIGKFEGRLLLAITALAAFVRLWKLGQPSSVVFDEVHFGGFASKYIKKEFFMDVHPPLAKMSIAFAGWLAGFDGRFDFKDIAKEYLIGENTPVPYVAMRTLCALFGLGAVPLAYLTLRGLSLRVTTATVGAFMVLFENALLTQSRYILLDSQLVFYTALTAFAWVGFCNAEKKHPAFSLTWWAWLAGVGVSLGCVVSVKWVGLFTIAAIGVLTIMQLWSHLGNTRSSMKTFVRHFFARVICLVGLPIVVYLIAFAVHLGRLQKSGSGDGFMSSEFQHTLRGHGMRDTYADVSLGSTVTLRHVNTHGGYLHSHAHNYPGGSGQQQITLYPHADENNEWYIIKAPAADEKIPVDDEGVPLTLDGPHEVEQHLHAPLHYLTNGMEIRLSHRITAKRLHSHDSNRPPITESDFQNEVTGYGFPGFAGDANDNFIVEIADEKTFGKDANKRVKALRTVFRLRHSLTGCYLFSHKIALPEWGFGQQEVTCNKQPTRPNTLWFIESNTHPLLESDPKAETVNYRRPRFFEKFWELQQVMWETNAGLTERHAYDSRPASWPWFRRGINFWNKDHRQVYLIGNLFIWWGSTASVFLYFGLRGLLMLRAKRGYKDWNDSTVVFYNDTAGFLVLGWAMHYVPFFAMARQLFIHHYLPALYFSILVFATAFDFLTIRLRPRFRLQAAAVVIAITIWMWSIWAPLSYGGEWTQAQCERARWRKHIDLDCINFPLSVTKYRGLPPPIHTAKHDSSAPAAAVTGQAGGAVPQPGNHAFENAPQKAKDSAVASMPAAANAPPEPVKVEEPIKVAPSSADPAAAAAPASSASNADPDAVQPEGLNNKQMEKVVLGGTAAEGVSGSDEGKAGGTAPTSVAN